MKIMNKILNLGDNQHKQIIKFYLEFFKMSLMSFIPQTT